MKWTLGSLYVMSVPYIAGLSSMSGLHLGGLRITGWIWVLLLVAGPLVWFSQRGKPRFPMRLWLPWFGYVGLSLTSVDKLERINLQYAGIFLTPFVVGIVASSVVRDERQVRVLRRAFKHCLIMLVVAFVVWWRTNSPLFEVRPMALTGCFLGCIAVAGWPFSRRKSLVPWAICLAIAVFTGSRMATLALLVLWVFHPVYRGVTSRGAAVILCGIVGLSLLFIPSFLERFFTDEVGSVEQVLSGDVSGTGRFEVWPVVWEQCKRHIVIGAGVGESSQFIALVWPNMGHPHNDYLRIIFELGLVGLVLFVFAVIFQLRVLRTRVAQSSGELKRAYTAAYLGFIALLLTSLTDNTIVYATNFMSPLFALLGAACGADAVVQAREVNIGHAHAGGPRDSKAWAGVAG